MVDPREDRAPDVLDVDDPAIVRREPPIPVWVDLAGLTDYKHHGRPYHPTQGGGVFVQGVAEGVLWAWIRTQTGPFLAAVTIELERSGEPFATASAIVPDWAISRRRPGSSRAYRGKTSNRRTAAQAADRADVDRSYGER